MLGFRWVLIERVLFLLGALVLGACTSFSSPDSLWPSLDSGVAASGLSWNQSSPSYSLSLSPSWSLASGVTVAAQSVQYYSDATCAVPSGAPVVLSATAVTDAFVASDQTTYSFKVTTKTAAGGDLVSACSGAIVLNSLACIGSRLTNAPYADGTGTALDPFLICTAAQMNAVGANSGDWAKNFKLLSDLDLAAYTGTQFNIIGTSGTAFTGVFDGGNHTISNLSINNDTLSGIGLFGVVSGASSLITNVTLANVAIQTSQSTVNEGALVGSITSGTVSNCKVTSGTIQQSSAENLQLVGGLVGNMLLATVSNSSSGITFLAGNTAAYVGGLVGYTNVSTISDSSFAGTIQSPNHASSTGGLAGSIAGTAVNRSYSTGSVYGNGTAAVGGLIGTMGGFSDVTASYAAGAVTGLTPSVGGLIGQLNVPSGHGVSNSYARGGVTGASSSYVGGLIGQVTTSGQLVTNCYSSGAMALTGAAIGGLIGRDSGSYGIYTNNFYDSQVNSALSAIGSGTAAAGNVAALTATLQTPATFSSAGWTSPTWNFTTSGMYLKLGWQP